MVDHARRNHVLVDVGEHVGAHYHTGIVVVECLYNLCQSVFTAVHVVGVELHGEFTALGMEHAGVPAAADAEVLAFGADVYYLRVAGILFDGFGCAVGGVVVDNDYVEGEVGFLSQGAVDGIADGAHAVAHGDNHRSFVGEAAGGEFHGFEHRFEVAADFLEVSGAGLLHFNL